MPVPSTALRSLDPADVVAALDGMRAHDIRLFTDLTLTELQEHLFLTPPARPVATLALGGARTIEACIASSLAQIGAAVAGLWPFLWGGEDFSSLRDDALNHAHLPIRLAALAAGVPGVKPSLAGELVLRLLRGRTPRLPSAPAEIEWKQLALAFAPQGLVIVIRLDADNDAPARIRALEWLAHHSNARIAILTDGPADAVVFERVSYRAYHITHPLVPNVEELQARAAPVAESASFVLALPPAPEGRPHPMSPIEQKLHKLIQADEELRPLFIFNKTVHLPLLMARIDLVWLGGRVAVEIDGPEHRTTAKFRADRHRDYELICAGYRVLRMTNEDVETDAALAVEKIRNVARLVEREGQ